MYVHQNTQAGMLIAALFLRAQCWKQLLPPSIHKDAEGVRNDDPQSEENQVFRLNHMNLLCRGPEEEIINLLCLDLSPTQCPILLSKAARPKETTWYSFIYVNSKAGRTNPALKVLGRG
jgi:hypothetical protein